MDLVPQFRAQLCRFLDGTHAIRMNGNAGWSSGREGNPQPAEIGAYFLKKWLGARWSTIGISNVGAGRGIEQRSTVPDRARDGMLSRQPAQSVAEVRAEGVAGTRGLQPEDATARCWDAD